MCKRVNEPIVPTDICGGKGLTALYLRGATLIPAEYHSNSVPTRQKVCTNLT